MTNLTGVSELDGNNFEWKVITDPSGSRLLAYGYTLTVTQDIVREVPTDDGIVQVEDIETFDEFHILSGAYRIGPSSRGFARGKEFAMRSISHWQDASTIPERLSKRYKVLNSHSTPAHPTVSFDLVVKEINRERIPNSKDVLVWDELFIRISVRGEETLVIRDQGVQRKHYTYNDTVRITNSMLSDQNSKSKTEKRLDSLNRAL